MRVFDVLTVHPLMTFIKEPVCGRTFFICIFKTCGGVTERHHTFLGTTRDHTSVTFLNIRLIHLKSFLTWTIISNTFITPRLPPGCTTSTLESDRERVLHVNQDRSDWSHITPLFATQPFGLLHGNALLGTKAFQGACFSALKTYK